jgi:CelD/BcsL family acetyltransferase involved in cellulose biosynthesis
LPELPGIQAALHDATSPYGYGGPFLSGAIDVEVVLTEAEEWLVQSGLCSAFIRLSLDLDVPAGPLTPSTEIVELTDNVVVDLRRTPEELWANYEHKVRKNVKKASRSGCTVRRDDQLHDVDAFVDVYQATMRRRGAAAWYHFDRNFFATLADGLAGSYSVFSVLDATGRVISVELVLESDRFLYSFLGGTLEDSFSMSPNDLLKHEAILHGQRTGRHGYVLGGGYERGDGIFRYKRAFDPDGVRGFRTARMIGDKSRYERLSSARHSLPTQSRGVFFPAYRAPVLAE